MRRTGGALVLLAALGGCTSTGQESDAGKKVTYDYRQQIPRPSDPSWMQNNRNMAYMNGQVAPYTRIGPGGAMPQAGTTPTTASQATATPAMSQVASAQPTPPPASPLTLPNFNSDPAGSLIKAPPPAAPVVAKMATEKPPERALAMNEPAAAADPSALKNTIAATIARSDAKTAEILGGSPLVNVPAPEKAKDLSTSMASNAKPDMLLAAGYLPGKNPLAAESRHGMPTTRIVNNKRITLNYKINDIGPSGVSGIDVWVTHDSRIWKKLDVGTQTHPPCIVEVGEEGLYGFTLVARNGLGLGKAPPQPGEPPQVWVDVDLSKPMVHLMGVETVAASRPSVAIRWNATDKNLAPRPITISYSDYSRGPWIPVATGVENSGRFVWQVPASTTGRFLMRVEATDLAGNVGMAQTVDPVVIDVSQPSISILNVEAGGK